MNKKKLFLLLFLSINLSSKPTNLPTSTQAVSLSMFLALYPSIILSLSSKDEKGIAFCLTYPLLSMLIYNYLWDYTGVGQCEISKKSILRMERKLLRILPEVNNYDENVLEHFRNYYGNKKFPLAYAHAEFCKAKYKYERFVNLSSSVESDLEPDEIDEQKKIMKSFNDNCYVKLIQAINIIQKTKDISKEIRSYNHYKAKMKSIKTIEKLKTPLWIFATTSSLSFLYSILKK